MKPSGLPKEKVESEWAVMLRVLKSSVQTDEKLDQVLFEVSGTGSSSMTYNLLSVAVCGAISFGVFGFTGTQVRNLRWPAHACGDLQKVNKLVNKTSAEVIKQVTDLKVQVNTITTTCEGVRNN